MSKSKEMDELVEQVFRENIKARKKKIMLYMNELLYMRFKARCENQGQNVSAVLEAFIRRAVDALPDKAADKKVEKEMFGKLGSK